jgi:hypothetical protein
MILLVLIPYFNRQKPNDDAHRSLLFTHFLLEHREEECWNDVHPLLLEIAEFKSAWNHRQGVTDI